MDPSVLHREKNNKLLKLDYLPHTTMKDCSFKITKWIWLNQVSTSCVISSIKSDTFSL